jgi:tetraacyldisaccharide 4'-kinase
VAEGDFLPRAAERVWRGDGLGSRIARSALAPAEALYATAVAARGALYDRGLRATHPLALPALSVGNVTVGGTGKTPVAAWMAGQLRARGARPAIVLRGYGGDEPLVHRALNPGLLVIVHADRVAGAEAARAAGADVVVLDDAFQHRRARRLVDLVLVSADHWDGRVRLLPAGPWREPLSALRRASQLLVTRKAVSAAVADEVAAALGRVAPEVPVATVHLEADALRAAQGEAERPLASVAGERLLAVSAIGDPDAFRAQLEGAGASVDAVAFADHHAYTAAEAARLAARAAHADRVVCTLKDAVKLGPLWPRAATPLWYVSQRLSVERGAREVERAVDTLLAARTQ